MFSGCNNLTSLDLSGWITSGITDMDKMFLSCASLSELDLRDWKLYSPSMDSVFYNCSTLERVYVNEKWSNTYLKNTNKMFYGCWYLVQNNRSSLQCSCHDRGH